MAERVTFKYWVSSQELHSRSSIASLWSKKRLQGKVPLQLKTFHCSRGCLVIDVLWWKLKADDVFILSTIFTFWHFNIIMEISRNIVGRNFYDKRKDFLPSRRLQRRSSFLRFVAKRNEIWKVIFNVYLLLFTHRIKLLSLFDSLFFLWWCRLNRFSLPTLLICIFLWILNPLKIHVSPMEDFASLAVTLSYLQGSSAVICQGKCSLWWCKVIHHCSIIMFCFCRKLTKRWKKPTRLPQFNKPRRPSHLQFPLISCCHYVVCDVNFSIFHPRHSHFFEYLLASCRKWNLISYNDNVIIIRTTWSTGWLPGLSSWERQRLQIPSSKEFSKQTKVEKNYRKTRKN